MCSWPPALVTSNAGEGGCPAVNTGFIGGQRVVRGALPQEPCLPDQLCSQQGDLGPQSSFRKGLLFEGSFLRPLSGLWRVLEGHTPCHFLMSAGFLF